MVDIKPTASERLLIYRRRQGRTQAQEALRRGVPTSAYIKWEKGLNRISCPNESVHPLQDFEKCMLLRKRLGISQKELADILGRSRWWTAQMERGMAPWHSLIPAMEKLSAEKENINEEADT